MRPTKILCGPRGLEKPIPASDLKICNETSAQSAQKDQYHFEKVTLDAVLKQQQNVELQHEINDFLMKLKTHFKDSLIPAIKKCEADVLENLSSLRKGIKMEADLCFVLARPILEGLCSYWSFTACGEGWETLLQVAEYIFA